MDAEPPSGSAREGAGRDGAGGPGGAHSGTLPGIADPAGAAARGTRIRAANAMGRTRTAIVRGIGACLAGQGARRTTMVDIAAAAGVAKGTLYNHVRTRGEAYRLFGETEAQRAAALLRGGAGPGAALHALAEEIAGHPVLRRLATDEPAALVEVLRPGVLRDGPVATVREALVALVGEQVADLALRWLLSLILDPGGPPDRQAGAAALARLSGREGGRPADGAASGFG